MKNKLLMMLLSLTISFGLWLYVVNYVSLESEDTYHNIPVVLTGESALTDRGLMITSGRNTTVSLKLSGKRTDLNKLDSSNITLEADLSKIYDAGGKVELAYDIRYPGGIPNTAFETLSQTPGVVTLTVEKRGDKNVPIVVDYGGTAVPTDYIAQKEEAVLDNTYVSISGPKSIVDQIEKAVIQVDLTDRTESFSEVFRYTLCNGEGEPVDLKELVTADIGEVRLDMTIQRYKMVPLWINVVDGGGATAETSTIVIEPRSIGVAGNEQVLEELEKIALIGEIKLGEITGDTTQTFTIDLPETVTNIAGVTEATVTISFPKLRTKELKIKNIQAINVPEGMAVDILTQELTVTVRGPAALVAKITEEDVIAQVDFSDATMGTATMRATIQMGEGFAGVGEMSTYSVTATLRQLEEEET